MADTFDSASDTVSAKSAVPITPDAPFNTSRAIWSGSGGTIVVRFAGATTTNVTFTDVPAGAVLPFQLIEVIASGTDATDLLALY